MQIADSLDRIAIDPDVMLGKPVILVPRITGELILRELGDDVFEADLLDVKTRRRRTTLRS